jgi:signal transduction histidine kinase
LTLQSLRLRMMGLAVVWVVASLIAAGLALQYLFSINIERTSREDMEAALSRLAAVIVPTTAVPSLSVPLPDPRYATPFGGRYWQIEALDNGEIARSRSLWDVVLDTHAGDNMVHYDNGPDNEHLILLSRRLEIEGAAGTRSYLVTVGQDHGPLHEAAQRFARDVTRVLLLLGGLIILAAWLQIKLGLAPIRRVKTAIEAVRRGDVSRLEGRFPSELNPLVQEVNGLLEARDTMMERARARAADLAHGLKTPLAAVDGIADRIRERGGHADADLLQDLTFEMSERIDYQLRLAALRVRTSSHAARSSLNTAVIRTLTVLKKTGRGEGLHWIAELTDDCWVDIHRQDLMELVGVTLENAAKWASSRVTVRTSCEDGQAMVEVCDDGPGIPQEKLQSLGVRGRRLDESLPGSGLGLAIAAEILDINHGSMDFSRAQIGGLIVTLRLPLAGQSPPADGG